MTRHMRQLTPLVLHTWGGFAASGGDMAGMLTASENQVALVGGGSGLGYLIDAILLLSELHRSHPAQHVQPLVHIVFATRNLNLVQFFIGVCQHAFRENSNIASVLICLTTGGNANHGVKNILGTDANFAWGSIQLGRPDLATRSQNPLGASRVKQRRGDTHVFCQGSLGLQQATAKAVVGLNRWAPSKLIFHEAHSFDSGAGNVQ